MGEPLLQKLYIWSRAEAIQDLYTTYITQGSVVVNFLYFANLARQRLVEWTPQPAQKQYLQALLASDFLFADGIALQLFYRWFSGWPKGTMPENLNWTDLNPALIAWLLQKTTVSLYLYQCYDPPKGKTLAYLETGIAALQYNFPGLMIPWASQCLFREKWNNFDWESLHAAVVSDTAAIKIFFNCTWTPFQEIWAQEHEHRLRAYWFLIINAWWTIDYMNWYEQRAPQWVVKARVLETFWRICTKPTKNLKKFLRMFGFFRILAKKLLQLTRR